MKTLAIIGSQWGDEGKGKITDLLSQKCDLVVRYQGGANAGHTIIVDDKKIVLHLIPSGILHPHALSIVGHGVVFDPDSFLKEKKDVEDSNIHLTRENLRLSSHATLITTYHKLIDSCRESKGPIKIGTTGKGIGPSYEDKISRKGIKLKDLTDLPTLTLKLERMLQEKKVLFEHLYQVSYPTVEDEAKRLYELGKFITPFLDDTFSILDQAIMAGKKILYEGAQGILLDVDYGTYPYVTSSSTSIGGVYTGAGVPGSKLDEVLGITKAYTTRVGEGPFPTELFDEVGAYIQNTGKEIGATTGRKRRCGWLDLPLLKYAVKSSNITSIALTKLDILSNMDTLKVCVAYEFEGKTLTMSYPGLDLSKVTPIYKELLPFRDNFQGDLSNELQTYIKTIEEFLEIKVGILAFGPERSQIRFLKNYF